MVVERPLIGLPVHGYPTLLEFFPAKVRFHSLKEIPAPAVAQSPMKITNQIRTEHFEGRTSPDRGRNKKRDRELSRSLGANSTNRLWGDSIVPVPCSSHRNRLWVRLARSRLPIGR